MSRKRRGTLTEDDLEVWRKVARTATPLDSRPVFRPASGPQSSSSAAPPKPARPDPVPDFAIGSARKQAAPSHELLPTIERSLAAAPVRMDKKTFGRMKKGKLRPERKLDLHGMTLAQAHPELNRFIQRAHADGCRLVIIVTGKGRSGRDEGGPIPTPRGVLRHQVPGWLHSAVLRPFVLQVTDAHVRHGGSGAYYVYLTRSPAASVWRD